MHSLFLWWQSILGVHLYPSESNRVSLVWRWRYFKIRSIFSYCLNLFLFYFLTSATSTILKKKKKITSCTVVYTHDRNNKNTQGAYIKQCDQNEVHTLLCCDRHNGKKFYSLSISCNFNVCLFSICDFLWH